MLTCSRCKTEKSESEFYRCSARKSGHQAWCKPCASAVGKVHSKRLYLENRDAYLARAESAYLRNPERAKASARAWKKRNPEKLRVYTRNRYAAKIGAVGSHTIDDLMFLLRSQDYLCVTCHRDISDNWSPDHIVPLALGGSNDPANIQLLCPSCNFSKGNKSMDAFQAHRKKRSVTHAIP